MAGRQNLLQDPIPLRIIKVDMEDNKSGYGDSKSGFGDNKSGFGDNKKDTAIIKRYRVQKAEGKVTNEAPPFRVQKAEGKVNNGAPPGGPDHPGGGAGHPTPPTLPPFGTLFSSYIVHLLLN
jgi:hypothetical protein